MPNDAQMISLLSHTLGSIGQVLKKRAFVGLLESEEELEVWRIYEGYRDLMKKTWTQDE